MNENLTTIIISLITVLFGGGAWKFYEFIIKKKSNDKKAEMSEKTMYRDDLKKRVSILEEKKEECQNALMEISKSLSSL
jgi:primosomal protein N''